MAPFGTAFLESAAAVGAEAACESVLNGSKGRDAA